MAYASVQDVRAWLGIYDNADDPQLTIARDAAQEAVRRWCGQDFSLAASATAKLFAANHRVVLDIGADGWSIGDTTGMAVATDEDDDGIFEEVWAATDWQTEPLNGAGPGGLSWPVQRLRAVGDYRWPIGGTGRARVQVTAVWGWSAVPVSVKTATIMLTAAWHQRRATLTGRGGFDGFFASSIQDDETIRDLLAPYRTGTAHLGFA